jgi:hypothetical protein
VVQSFKKSFDFGFDISNLFDVGLSYGIPISQNFFVFQIQKASTPS